MKEDIKKLRKELIEKYLNNGISEFSDLEVLELLLSFSLSSSDFRSTAQNLINVYGSLNPIMDSDSNILIKKDSLDEKSAVLLRIIPQLSRILSLKNLNFKKLSSSAEAKKYFRTYFIGISKETLAVVCTDEKLNIISEKNLTHGSSVALNISCREIAEFTLKNKASSIFLAHNHPFGSAQPSQKDILSTRHISKTLSNIGITLIDHIIVSDNSAVSIRNFSSHIFTDTISEYKIL